MENTPPITGLSVNFRAERYLLISDKLNGYELTVALSVSAEQVYVLLHYMLEKKSCRADARFACCRLSASFHYSTLISPLKMS